MFSSEVANDVATHDDPWHNKNNEKKRGRIKQVALDK